MNAILYLNKTGCQWRVLPKEFPPWQTVYDHYSTWNRRGVWEAALNALNAQHRKNDKARKRHIVVDTLGQLIQMVVHAANVHDTKGGCDVSRAAYDKCPSLAGFSGDAGYRGTAVNFVEETLKLKLDISKKIKDCFAVLPMRWGRRANICLAGQFTDDCPKITKFSPILTRTAENMVRIGDAAHYPRETCMSFTQTASNNSKVASEKSQLGSSSRNQIFG